MKKPEIKPKRQYRRHDREFKLEAVKLVLEKGMKVSEVSMDLGISYHMLWKWVEEYRAEQAGAFPGKGKLKPQDQRVKELEEKVRRLEMERDILKKAMAYFAKEPQ